MPSSVPLAKGAMHRRYYELPVSGDYSTGALARRTHAQLCVRGHPRHAGGQGQQQTVVSGAQPHRRKWLGGWAFFGGPIFQIAYGASCTASTQYSWRACHLRRLHVGRACGFRTKRFLLFLVGAADDDDDVMY